MPIPGSSTPGPLACDQATRPPSLHSLWPGSCRRIWTRVPTGAACCEFPKTPPTDRLVPQPLKVPASEVTPTITSWWTRALRRVGDAGLEALLIHPRITWSAADQPPSTPSTPRIVVLDL